MLAALLRVTIVATEKLADPTRPDEFPTFLYDSTSCGRRGSFVTIRWRVCSCFFSSIFIYLFIVENSPCNVSETIICLVCASLSSMLGKRILSPIDTEHANLPPAVNTAGELINIAGSYRQRLQQFPSTTLHRHPLQEVSLRTRPMIG